MKSGIVTLVALLGFGASQIGAAVPAFAHHGTNVSYDMDPHARVTVTGIVTEWRMKNPHCQLYWDVTEEDGSVTHWSGEISAVFHLAKAGWNRNSIKPGDEVAVTLSPSRAGAPAGVMWEILLPDGRVMERDDGRENWTGDPQ